MSRTRQSGGSVSPVKKYLSFSGSKGEFKFYDKNHPDADAKGHVYLPEIKLTVLDIKSSISGYNEGASSGISSNLLNPFDVGKVPFVVRTKVEGKYGVFAEGIYKDIKDKVSGIGGKFTTNVFALVDLGDGPEIVRIDFNGSALGPWIELQEGMDDVDIYDLEITAKKGNLLTRKGGKTTKVTKKEYETVMAQLKKDPMSSRPVWFYAPEFSTEELSEELSELAIKQDEVLQEYFDATGNAPKEEVEQGTELDDMPKKEAIKDLGTKQEDDDDLLF